jgi:hypothetical protein
VAERLLAAAELAEWLAVDASYVYEYADQLGALRLGSGPRARLCFDRAEASPVLQNHVSICAFVAGRRLRRWPLGRA